MFIYTSTLHMIIDMAAGDSINGSLFIRDKEEPHNAIQGKRRHEISLSFALNL